MQKCPQKSLAVQGFPRAKRLHCGLFLLFTVLTHSGCGLLAACFGGTAFRAVHPFPVNEEWLAAQLAVDRWCVIEYSIQLRCFGQYRFPKISAQGAVGIADTKHIAVARRRKLGIARFRASTKSSLTPLLLLSPKSLTTFRGPR